MKANNSLYLLLFWVLSIGATNEIWAQDDYHLPHNEHRPYYQLKEYPRGYDKDSMEMALNELLNKPAKSWKNKDSLDYLFTLIAIQEFDKAFEYYKKFKKVNPRSADEFHLIQYLFSFKRMFDKTHNWLEREKREYPDSKDVINIRIRLHDAEEQIITGNWSEDSVIFPVLFSDEWQNIKKGTEPYLTQTIPMIERFDLALRDETKFEFQSNRALAISFYEYGIFLEKNLSTSDAFIALSIARYYDKFNAKITEKYREIRSLMNKRNLIFPSMRELFPKQNKGIFNIENIKKRRQEERDSISQIDQQPMTLQMQDVKKTDFLTGKMAALIILIGLTLLLLFVAIFVKIKR